MRKLVAISAVLAFGVATIYGAGATRPVTAGDAISHVHGQFITYSDADLTAKAPLVVDAFVDSVETLVIGDDPLLPAGWETDPEMAAVINDGARETKWEVTVNAWIKGSSTGQIYVVQPASHVGPASTIVAGSAGPGGGDALAPGSSFRLWLEPWDWFGAGHYVLLKATSLA